MCALKAFAKSIDRARSNVAVDNPEGGQTAQKKVGIGSSVPVIPGIARTNRDFFFKPVFTSSPPGGIDRE
jgi:hypothetical protein